MAKTKPPGPRQLQVRAALAELALTYRRIEHGEALEYLGTRMDRLQAYNALRTSYSRNCLPPGAKRTATHIEFA